MPMHRRQRELSATSATSATTRGLLGLRKGNRRSIKLGFRVRVLCHFYAYAPPIP